jgi:hypothetical protein
MIFIELPLFQKHIAFTDEELRAVQAVLFDNPEAGDLIQGSGGLRKLRAAVGGRGKRGGARVIYYWRVSASVCYLLLAYPKNVLDDLTPDQIKALARVVKEEIGNG